MHLQPKFKIQYLFFFLAAIALFTSLIMVVWNALIPQIFNGPSLSFFQTAGLLFLSRLLLAPMSMGHCSTKDKPWKQGISEHIKTKHPNWCVSSVFNCKPGAKVDQSCTDLEKDTQEKE